MAIETFHRTDDASDSKPQKVSKDSQWTVDVMASKKDGIEDCDYKRAIEATGHGRYNNLLLLAAVCPIVSSLFSTSTISFVLPSAECDLMITNFHKGLLNAVTYLGMISTAFFWGFLSDTMGRQKLIYITYGMDALFNFIAGLAQNFTVLLLAKLADGLICSAPYAIIMTYLAECNPDSCRASVVQWSGLLTAFGTILLPLLAWAILPLDLILIDTPSFTLNSWRIFLLLSTIPSAVGAICFYFRWESPKFLLSKGRADEALKILRQMYVINTGNTPESYPVKSLHVEKPTLSETNLEQKSSLRALAAGLSQIKPFFQPPYLGSAAVVFSFQFGSLMGYNTVRLWLPQLFASIMAAENSGLVENATTVCGLLSESQNKTQELNPSVEWCSGEQAPVDWNVYLNSILIGLITCVGFTGAGYLTRCAKDTTLILFSTTGAVVACIAMYWGVTSNLMLVFSSLFITFTSISSTAILSVTMQIFPTEIRTMAVSLVMMFGQIGGMLGNVLFPLLLDWNCMVLFFLMAAVIFATGLLVIFLPKDKCHNKA